jgi:hypothetical protein
MKLLVDGKLFRKLGHIGLHSVPNCVYQILFSWCKRLRDVLKEIDDDDDDESSSSSSSNVNGQLKEKWTDDCVCMDGW